MSFSSVDETVAAKFPTIDGGQLRDPWDAGGHRNSRKMIAKRQVRVIADKETMVVVHAPL